MSLLQVIRERLMPSSRRESVVLEYYVVDPEGRIAQRECVIQEIPGKLTVNCADGWTQRLMFKEVEP